MISDRKVDCLIAFTAGIAAKFDAPPFPRQGSDAEATEWTLALLRGVVARLEATKVPPSVRCPNGHHVYATDDAAGDWWSPARCPVCNAPVGTPIVEPPGARGL